MNKIIYAFLVSCLLLITGCNTIEGIGKDIKRGGEVLEDAASDAKGDK